MKTNTSPPARRRTLPILGVAMLILAGATACAGTPAPAPTGSAQAPAAVTQAAGPIEGVQVYTNLGSKHVKTPVTYEQSPGVGGDHNPAWTNCGIYTKPVEETRAVHSMEHGAVWLTYRPDLPAAQVQKLTDLVGSSGYVLLSPYAGQASPVTATAWGAQLAVDSASDARMEQFLSKYVQGEQTPEPGAPCTGGVDG
jgi:hypothetical protein